jgi:putative transport protein
MDPFYDILRKYPELSVFLTLAIGFYVGRLKIAGCSIGSVTGVLLTGLLIGQADIPISPAIKSVFFLFFLFAVGYGVGPQFFRGLKSEGLGQALFATLVCLVCLVTAFLTARLHRLFRCRQFASDDLRRADRVVVEVGFRAPVQNKR